MITLTVDIAPSNKGIHGTVAPCIGRYPRKDLVRVAAYQAPLPGVGSMASSMDALGLIRKRVEWCEVAGVTILCCPEAILGGLADYAEHPTKFAIPADDSQLESALAPIASDTVTTIVGFTELGDGGRL